MENEKYMLRAFTIATKILPERLWRGVYTLSDREKTLAEEFRLRAGQPMCITINGKNRIVFHDGLPIICTHEEILECVERATKSSLHSFNNQLKEGFIPLSHGGRMGVCGEIVLENLEVRTIKDISSLNIRIARQVIGLSTGIFNLIEWQNRPNILIISRAGVGKTTFLRDLICKLSKSGHKIGIADERFEIGGCAGGVPTFDLGENTDIISGGHKHQSVDMLVRTMSPDYIAFDEITRQCDGDILKKSAYMGSGILATAHCAAMGELENRPLYREILEQNIFDYIVEIQQAEERNYNLFKKGGKENGQAYGSLNDYHFIGKCGGIYI